MTQSLDKVFEDERLIQKQLLIVANALLDVSSAANNADSLSLAAAESACKRMILACDKIASASSDAKVRLLSLAVKTLKASIGDQEYNLDVIQDKLALVENDAVAIKGIAQNFASAGNKIAAYTNINAHYAKLAQDITELFLVS